ncbi:enoyl-CoA hydratase/isomerase family protein [Nocardioides zeae]|uniref:Enoyl-CoA hydratase n=1 Tax=Nocardioides zeae TaxID=1457234 RepID=A0AAJ1U0N7_9ACTN|nr:enoyl-CoA hydratase/isomerase family protein [Nocardioides zeae]MDQ1105700.1 enoyl-CoA hydratase [Nocardioides zeae]
MTATDDHTETDGLLVEHRDHVAYLTLNRPHRHNALDSALKRDLVRCASDLAEDPEVRVVVLSGAGDRAFCVGADLKEIDQTARAGRRLTTPMTGEARNVFEAVLEIPKPTIAAIDGYALAGGFELAMACDLRIATHGSVFGMPEAKIGMGANFASVMLPRLVGPAVAYELLYTAERFDAARALDVGLLMRVVDSADLTASVEALARGIARNAPLSLFRYKQMVLRGMDLPVPAALRLNVGPNPYASADREEGVRAFLEKREASWQAR